MEAMGLTYPEAGVMATSPATEPETPPKALGFPLKIHSAKLQESVAVAAAKWVAMKALAAHPPEETALPALKPNQPNQSKAAPVMVMVRLWGMIGSLP